MILALGALLAVVLIAVGGVLLLSRDPDPPELRTSGLTVEGMLDSIGVNVHFSYVDRSYARRDEALALVRELGVRHLRDAVPSVAVPLEVGLAQAARAGLDLTLITDVNRDPDADVSRAMQLLDGNVAAFEAPNELDNSGDPDWASKLSSFVPRLDAAVRAHAPGVPLIGPSLLDPSSRAEFSAALPGAFNGHPYAAGGPPEPALAVAVDEGRAGTPKQQIYFTETGYHNALAATTGQPPVSEQAAAVYMPRALVDAYGAGVRRTFIYELLDEKPDPGGIDPEQHFGLLRADLTRKPAFTAIKNLTAALRTSPGAGDGPLDWTLDADPSAGVQHLTMTRRDGSRVLAIWRAVSVWDAQARRPLDPGTEPVELAFDRPAGDLTVWRPSVSSGPVRRRDSASRLRLDLAGDLVLVSLR